VQTDSGVVDQNVDLSSEVADFRGEIGSRVRRGEIGGDDVDDEAGVPLEQRFA
jgi:hypothetical protein